MRRRRLRSGLWRLVYSVQKLISWLAPPLHSLHWKIFVLLLAGLFVPALYIAWKVGQGIEKSHLQSTESGMIDLALVLAQDFGEPDAMPHMGDALQISREVFGDPSLDLRVVCFDRKGFIIYDTAGTWVVGTKPESGSDVSKALRGSYGARWEHDQYRRAVILHSTVPVYRDGAVVGAISVIKPTSDVRKSVLRSLRNLAIPVLLALLLSVSATYVLSSYLTQVITDLARKAERIAAGAPGVKLETWTKSELGSLARALERMRLKLEGKTYVEEMATTLSHELKTPLAAIRGATEVIEDSDSPEIRLKFLENIRAETDRLAGITDNLLALSRLEAKPTQTREKNRLSRVAAGVVSAYAERAETYGLIFTSKLDEKLDTPVAVPVDEAERVIEILLDNAFAFTPRGKGVHLETSGGSVTVRDEGNGIEPGFEERLFERFFTTINPLTGRRGTGLGLSILKSIVDRHRGSVSVKSTPGEGAEFTVTFPPIS